MSLSLRWEPVFQKRDERFAERLEKGLLKEGFRLDPDQLERLVDVACWYRAIKNKPPLPTPYQRARTIGHLSETARLLTQARPEKRPSILKRMRRHLGGDEFYQCLIFDDSGWVDLPGSKVRLHLGQAMEAFHSDPGSGLPALLACLANRRLALESRPSRRTLICRAGDSPGEWDEADGVGRSGKLAALLVSDCLEIIEPLQLTKGQQVAFLVIVFGHVGEINGRTTIRDRIKKAERHFGARNRTT